MLLQPVGRDFPGRRFRRRPGPVKFESCHIKSPRNNIRFFSKPLFRSRGGHFEKKYFFLPYSSRPEKWWKSKTFRHFYRQTNHEIWWWFLWANRTRLRVTRWWMLFEYEMMKILKKFWIDWRQYTWETQLQKSTRVPRWTIRHLTVSGKLALC